MRPRCFDCSRKHIGQAEILMEEAELGYCLHAWLAVSHLAEAEAELMKDCPEMAQIIRAERLNYIDGLKYSIYRDDVKDGVERLDLQVDYKVDTLALIEQITLLKIEKDANIDSKAPLSPHILADALQDKAHTDIGVGRPAKSTKVKLKQIDEIKK